MKGALRTGTLLTFLMLSVSMGACAPIEDETTESGEGAVIQLPELNIRPTVQAFQSDPTAKGQLDSLLATEARNSENRVRHDAEIANMRGSLDTAKRKLKEEKAAWRAAGHTRRCWLFFKCTDWRGATAVDEAKAQIKEIRRSLRDKPTFVPEPVEPINDLIDRVAKEHDAAGYGKVAPINGALARLDAPANAHITRVTEVKSMVATASRLVRIRQEHLDRAGADAQILEDSLEAETETVATKLDELNLAIRDLSDTFRELKSALERDEHYRQQFFPTLPAAIDPELTNFPMDLDDRTAQSARTRDLAAALARIDGSLDGHLSSLGAYRADVARSRQDALAWVRNYLAQSEAAIRPRR